MYVDADISQGQEEARTRWGTHESGAAFDRKKCPFLSEEAREFIAQQGMCVVVGPGPEQEPYGLLLAGLPGFVETPDNATCLIPVDRRYETSPLVQGHTRCSSAWCIASYGTLLCATCDTPAYLCAGRSGDCVRAFPRFLLATYASKAGLFSLSQIHPHPCKWFASTNGQHVVTPRRARA